MDYFVHQSSFVELGVCIGRGTKVWHFCHVMEDVQIGADVVLGQNVFVGRGVKIGDRSRIQNNVSIFEGVTLEEDVFCGPSVVFTNVKRPRVSYPQGRELFGQILLRRGCTIGANATILSGLVIGTFSLVGAGAVITRSVPDYSLVYGNPATHRGWICSCGREVILNRGRGNCIPCGKRFRRDEESGGLRIEGT